ncbi:MAG: GNAT family N-acetyltransferase [Oscillatoria sp. PMC 1051.18]|nr:GNAT family N-acetyltransferase [Oscillatoria sp. PMC 1050.18]MEC5030580.1 GNAT family N-acetyltransferase [Oscillatoria sp. PMC 1051.18]
MIIRVATNSDILELGKLYTDSVLHLAPQYYSDQQVQMWASFPSQRESFAKFILEPTTFIIQEAETILGFSGIANDGHIASVYVHYNYLRKKIGSRLLATVLEYAQSNKIKRLYAEASEFSKPLFAKFGFEIYATEQVERNGVLFERYLVQKFN